MTDPNEMHLENKRNFTDRELFDIPKKITASSLNSPWRIIVKKPAASKAEIPATKPQTEKQYEKFVQLSKACTNA